MICPACRTDNPDAALSCAHCGKTLARRVVGPGSVIAERYEVQEPLGAGGMGMVYKARDRTLDETVAIKIIHPDFAQDPTTAHRFKSEIKLARKVRHRNVCAIHDFGEDQGLLYISMEFIDGRDLKEIVRKTGPLDSKMGFDTIFQIAEGLQAIHEAGVIHRDLKLANIMRDGRGVVRLMDFGIARGWQDESMTKEGQVIGSPEYMSPEQATAQKVDFRSDLYSFGIMIFVIFTGRVPFRGDSPVATMLKHVKEPPPLDGPEADPIPKPLVPVLRRALAKDRSDRYSSCREMIAALQEAQSIVSAHPTESLAPVPPDPRMDSAESMSASPAAGDSAARPPSRGKGDGGGSQMVVGPSSDVKSRPSQTRRLLPKILGALRSQDAEVRSRAAQALGRTGDASCIPQLTEALEDPVADVRVQVARTLGLLGTQGLPTLPALRRAASDRDESVRSAATQAIAQLDLLASRGSQSAVELPAPHVPEVDEPPKELPSPGAPVAVQPPEPGRAGQKPGDPPTQPPQTPLLATAEPAAPNVNTQPTQIPPGAVPLRNSKTLVEPSEDPDDPQAPLPARGTPAAAERPRASGPSARGGNDPAQQGPRGKAPVAASLPHPARGGARPRPSRLTLRALVWAAGALVCLGAWLLWPPPPSPIPQTPPSSPTLPPVTTVLPYPETPYATPPPKSLPPVEKRAVIAPVIPKRSAPPPPTLEVLPTPESPPTPSPPPPSPSPPPPSPPEPPPTTAPSPPLVPAACLLCPKPPYPPLAQRLGVEGSVLLRIQVDESGAVARIEVIGGPQELREAAMKAVRKWRYRPATRGGVPVQDSTEQKVTFELGK